MMNKWIKNTSGVITVMVSLLLIPLLSFGTLIMEAGRYVSARQMLADAQITASMSILANYNVYLYERFGVIAINPDATAAQTKENFITELKYNSDNVDGVSSSSKLYNLNSDVTFETIYNLSDYAILKRQILEYSKYSVPYEIISKKLDPSALFDKIAAKLTDNAVFNFIEKIAKSSQEAVNVMDYAFTALGRYEYRSLDLLNFLSSDSDQKYNKDNYTTTLWEDYISDDGDIDDGKLSKYSKSERYVSGREAYVNAINEKTQYMNDHPDPQKSLDAANKISVSGTTVTKTNLYKAAIKAFLEDPKNEPPDDMSTGATITEYTKVDLKVVKPCGYDYSLENGTAWLVEDSGKKNEKVNILDAVRGIRGKSTEPLIISNYTDLEEFAEEYNIKASSSTYLDSYNTALTNNGKVTAKENLIDALEKEKNTYDKDIKALNEDIGTGKESYKADLQTAKTKFEALILSIEDDSKKVKKLVENDEGEMVFGTEDSSYNEGAVGRLKYANDTYKKTTENEGKSSESEADSSAEAKQLGSNSENVKLNAEKVIEELNGVKASAQQAVGLIDVYIKNLSDIQPSAILSVSLSENNEDTVKYISNNTTMTAVVGATCGKLAGYAKSDFTTITEFIDTPVVDAESNESFDINKLAGTLGISDIWDSFKKIKDVLNVVPATHDPSYVVTINEADRNLLPTMVGDGKDSASPYKKEDEEYRRVMMDNVENTLGKVFSNTVFGDMIEDADTETFRSTTAKLFGGNGEGGTENSKMSSLHSDADTNKTKGLGKLVSSLKKIVDSIKEAFNAIKSLFTEIKNLFDSFVKQSVYAILINTYIIQKFPNRMKPVDDAMTYPAEQTAGSYFSGCCVEYCMFGNASEKTNQVSVFWLIFGIKAVINCIQILLDTEAMSLVSSCNIFAPLMFIAMLYMETNIDMNNLLRLGKEVPIWKGHLNLSLEGLKEIAGDLIEIEKSGQKVRICKSGAGKRYHTDHDINGKPTCMTITSSDKRKVVTEAVSVKDAINKGYTACQVCKPTSTEGEVEEDPDEGIIPMDYTEYLYVLMLFISTNTKVQHVADLIQLETRYYESEQGIKSSFKIDKAATYVRSDVVASYDSLLPMFSLGSAGGFAEIGGVEYVGY